MKLIIIFGPHAAGKMTVGQHLAEITDLKLFHNHMTIEPITDLFRDYPEHFKRLKDLFREEIFNAFLQTDQYGIIFTFMWAFDTQEDWDYINNLEQRFLSQGAEVYFVELEADFDVRIQRNRSENRLNHKPSKRNIRNSEQLFRNLEQKYRLNSLPDEIKKEHYLRINNTEMSPHQTAQLIKQTFSL